MKKLNLIIIFAGIFLGMFCFVKISQAANWYVDNAASGSNNGTSWVNAWQSFANIIWGGSGIIAGDTLYISGGSVSKTYTTTLTIGASGSTDNPIYIKPGSASPSPSGHSGVVTITVTSGSGFGISITNKNWITINGNYNNSQNIRITGCSNDGIVTDGSNHHNVLTYLEVDSNGNGSGDDGIDILSTQYTTFPSIEISYCKVHGNYQDQIHAVPSQDVISPGTYGVWSIHHCEIYDLHDDGVESGLPGLDFYENVMHTLATPVSIGHPDGMAQNVHTSRIYNNIFHDMNGRDMGAYIYLNPLIAGEGGYHKVYNNLLYTTATSWDPEEYSHKGFEITPQMSSNVLTNVIIANNTFIGFPNYAASLLLKGGGQVTGNLNNIYFVNNIVRNNGRKANSPAVAIGAGNHTVGSWGDGKQLTFDYNSMSASSGTNKIDWKDISWDTYNQFINRETGGSGIYPQDGITEANATADPLLDSNYRLMLSSPIKDRGVDASSLYFGLSIDKDGISRPQGAAWDIGAYEYVEAAPPPDTTPPNPPTNVTVI